MSKVLGFFVIPARGGVWLNRSDRNETRDRWFNRSSSGYRAIMDYDFKPGQFYTRGVPGFHILYYLYHGQLL